MQLSTTVSRHMDKLSITKLVHNYSVRVFKGCHLLVHTKGFSNLHSWTTILFCNKKCITKSQDNIPSSKTLLIGVENPSYPLQITELSHPYILGQIPSLYNLKVTFLVFRLMLIQPLHHTVHHHIRPSCCAWMLSG